MRIHQAEIWDSKPNSYVDVVAVNKKLRKFLLKHEPPRKEKYVPKSRNSR